MARTSQRLRATGGTAAAIGPDTIITQPLPARPANQPRKPAAAPRNGPATPAPDAGADGRAHGRAQGNGRTGRAADASSAAGARRARAGAREMPVMAVLSALVLGYAWTQRNEGHITAETGLGYWLGIVGGSLMLALLIYPLRKRLPLLRHLGEIRSWFRWHMILGIVGPVLVILHSNFRLGSLNSRVALITMLIVAGSGIIGRFLYAGIHRGLYGRRSSVRECMEALGPIKAAFDLPESRRAEIRAELEAYEARRIGERLSLWRAVLNRLSRPFSRAALRRRIMARLSPTAPLADERPMRDAFEKALKGYLDAVARAENFSLYERLFALWHLLHLPLFVLLVLAASVHVLAVHLY